MTFLFCMTIAYATKSNDFSCPFVIFIIVNLWKGRIFVNYAKYFLHLIIALFSYWSHNARAKDLFIAALLYYYYGIEIEIGFPLYLDQIMCVTFIESHSRKCMSSLLKGKVELITIKCLQQQCITHEIVFKRNLKKKKNYEQV